MIYIYLLCSFIDELIMDIQQNPNIVPDYLDESHDEVIKSSVEWERYPTKSVTVKQLKYVEVIVLDAGTWIPATVAIDGWNAWRVSWSNNRLSIRIPRSICSFQQLTFDLIRDDMIKVILPHYNIDVNTSSLKYATTMMSFFIYLIKYGDILQKDIRHLPRFVNVEPIRMAIIKKEKF